MLAIKNEFNKVFLQQNQNDFVGEAGF